MCNTKRENDNYSYIGYLRWIHCHFRHEIQEYVIAIGFGREVMSESHLELVHCFQKQPLTCNPVSR